ncbi:hypothetical protein B0H66DRAFT_548541 [Apodospora peruviana]|uniref:Uncharacterized protein n=1 Tax=Apodospora peruviana TaxID=516989 RepID=A0AAE0IID6_9PEZI|nr:hypothetical protein B0H66DRAFT_548541 [Apodospora peruviana]
MFELPDAKRVRREDLFDTDSRHSSPEEEEQAEIQARLKARLSQMILLDLDDVVSQKEDGDDSHRPDKMDVDHQPDEQPEFEFRLFSAAPPQKVVLEPQEDAAVDELQQRVHDAHAGSMVAPRAVSHYIRGELSAEERTRFQLAAVAGSEVVRRAKQERAWGLEVPWRVTKITVSSSSSSSSRTRKGGGDDEEVEGKERSATENKKKKLGKKGRIAARTKEKAAAALQKDLMTKEEHLKEKKKRLNREKKLKRRKKEKEKKLATAGAGGQLPKGSGAEFESEADE